MTVQNDCVSSCCGAELDVKGEDTRNILSCTMYYTCSKCGYPCNWQSKNTANKKDLKEFEEIIDENIEVFKRLAKK